MPVFVRLTFESGTPALINVSQIRSIAASDRGSRINYLDGGFINVQQNLTSVEILIFQAIREQPR